MGLSENVTCALSQFFNIGEVRCWWGPRGLTRSAGPTLTHQAPDQEALLGPILGDCLSCPQKESPAPGMRLLNYNVVMPVSLISIKCSF